MLNRFVRQHKPPRYLILAILPVIAILLAGNQPYLSRVAPTSVSSQIDTNWRTIHFSGYDWLVKAGVYGPGNNTWSDAPESVWVDDEGRLHLKIRQVDGVWTTAEVVMPDVAQWGTYRVHVDTPLHNLDPNAILGLFLYRDDLREIDMVEIARWGQPGLPNAQYAIQPADVPNHLESFALLWEGATTHEIDWQPDEVRFRTLQRGQTDPDPLIYEWVYQGRDVPDATDELHLRFNLWLIDAPVNDEPIEVVISDIEIPEPSVAVESEPAAGCDLQLTTIYEAVIAAQAALDRGETDAALGALAEARTEIDRLERTCAAGDPSSETDARGDS